MTKASRFGIAPAVSLAGHAETSTSAPASGTPAAASVPCSTTGAVRVALSGRAAIRAGNASAARIASSTTPALAASAGSATPNGLIATATPATSAPTVVRNRRIQASEDSGGVKIPDTNP
ncbi:MAG: hypothetical protein ACT4QG_03750 [Sporichthyaceae bacterium]